MADSTLDIPMRRVMESVTMTVRITGERAFGLRVRLASALFRLAGVVLGVGEVDISTSHGHGG
jgi:hypothetical protein